MSTTESTTTLAETPQKSFETTEPVDNSASEASQNGGSFPVYNYPLKFKILKKCSTTKARCSVLELPHATLETPQFMPVGTQGALKGVLPDQIKELGCNLILGNTYHLGHRPGPELLKKAGGLHKFMNWDGALLTDSGGFQMVSLAKLSKVTEEGVEFQSPHDGSMMMLTPEKSMEIQNAIGADIMMQLDDVVPSTLEDAARMKEAMLRSIRWLDRCIAGHGRKSEQNLFPIVQGGLDPELRKISARELIKRNTSGYAIGGLSGGEEKDKFWRMVHLSTDLLPDEKPRYLMGVGFAIDLVVCSALGCDLFDCVFPTRTARFGSALVDNGQLQLKKKIFADDQNPIDSECTCFTCKTYTRSFLHTALSNEEVTACSLVSIHNVAFQMRLMKRIRESIKEDRFPQFVRQFVQNYYANKDNQKKSEQSNDKEEAKEPGNEVANEDGRPAKKLKKEAVKKQESSTADTGETNASKNSFSSNNLHIPDWIVNALKDVNIDVLEPI